MSQWTHKTDPIDAFEIGTETVPDWFSGHQAPPVVTYAGTRDPQPGDYVCKGLAGEIVTMDGEVFEATYDAYP
jgi:hypothetical protein